MNTIEGLLIVDKPEGWTSHDVVKKTKNLLGGNVKVGHTGTLDPFATGVLVLLIGNITKCARYFEHDTKCYKAEITFGVATDTYDKTGNVVSIGDPKLIDVEVLKRAIEKLVGRLEQYPPMYSAIKIGGKKLYHLARSGLEIELKPRIVTIYSIEYDLTGYPTITSDIECSKGTYIRSIADHLGKSVGCPAHLSALRRTRSGNFTLSDAVNLKKIVESNDTSYVKSLVQPFKLFGNKQ